MKKRIVKRVSWTAEVEMSARALVQLAKLARVVCPGRVMLGLPLARGAPWAVAMAVSPAVVAGARARSGGTCTPCS